SATWKSISSRLFPAIFRMTPESSPTKQVFFISAFFFLNQLSRMNSGSVAVDLFRSVHRSMQSTATDVLRRLQPIIPCRHTRVNSVLRVNTDGPIGGPIRMD